ncbi:MAG: NUDIX domain-containing protein [Planctomycetota bacterium]
MAASVESEEWLDIVDAGDRVIGRAPRAAFHGNPALRHRAVHTHVVDRAGRLLLQRRSHTKEVQPGRWDTAVGGHVASGESYQSAVHREVSEELGLAEAPLEELYAYEWRSPIETELVRTYLLLHEGPFRAPPSEILALEWFDLGRLRAPDLRRLMTPNLRDELRRLVEARPELLR